MNLDCSALKLNVCSVFFPKQTGCKRLYRGTYDKVQESLRLSNQLNINKQRVHNKKLNGCHMETDKDRTLFFLSKQTNSRKWLTCKMIELIRTVVFSQNTNDVVI